MKASHKSKYSKLLLGFLSILGLLLNFTAFSQPTILQTAINPENGHTYYLLTPDTWSNSETAAIGLGGHLATIRNQSENDWVWNQLGSKGNGNVWIGLYDPITGDGGGAQHEADFIWSSGETSAYRNWGGPPDNYANMQYYTHYSGGGWDDYQNSGIFNGVVEITGLPPVITVQPVSLTNLVGTTATFSVITTNLSVSYQWYFVSTNGAGQAGAYAETFGQFCVGAVVTNGGYNYGNIPNVSFVGGGGSGALGYASVSNGILTGITVTNAGYGYASVPSVVIDPPNGFLYGQTNSTLNVSNANLNNLGNYYVVISNSVGSVTSIVVNITLAYLPTVSLNPIGFTQNYGTSNALSVVAAGTPPLSYQWSLNTTNIIDATNDFYSINGLDITNTGSYTVEVINPYGSVYSSPVTVNMQPYLTTPFAGAVGLWGQTVDLNVGAIGSDILNYQWYFNGQTISGANFSSYVLSSIQFTNAGLYSVVVSSIYGSVTNTAYQVVVNPANIAIGTCPIIYINGTVGYNYTIQSSTNLADTNSWVTVTNITLNASSEIWPDIATDISQPANPKKFYRVMPGQ